MKEISKDLKEYILKRCSKPHISRTRHRIYIEMSAEVIRAIEKYEEENLKT